MTSKSQPDWFSFPDLSHIPTKEAREKMENRRRLRKVRYLLYRLRNQIENRAALHEVEGLLPGFIDFWLMEKPAYAIDPRGQKMPVPSNKNVTVLALGGYGTFAQAWDVDEELVVYLRHSSVWQEWNTILQKAVPIIGE